MHIYLILAAGVPCSTIYSVMYLCSIALLQCLSLQGVQQEGIGMIALRSVSVQMEESVNWTELAYALKDLVDPIAQNQVFETLAVCKYIYLLHIWLPV